MAIPALGFAGAALAAAVFAWMRTASPPAADALCLEAVLEPGAEVQVVSALGFALSPQGDRLAFVATGDDGKTAIWVRPLDGRVATMAPGTTNGLWPFWSPDGRALGFSAGGKILTLDLRSGTTRTLCPTDSDYALRGTWSSSDVILFPHDGVIYRTDPRGSACRPVTKRGQGQPAHSDPTFLPDGRRFVFAAGSALVGDLESGAQSPWMENAFGLQVIAPDWVVFHPASERLDVPPPLLVQRFDPRTLELHGAPAVLLRRILTPGGEASFSAAPNGVLVAVDDPPASRPLVWIGPSGQVTDTVPLPPAKWTFAASRDGRQVALGGFDMLLFDLQRGVLNPVPVEAQSGRATLFPAWSHDDEQLAYHASYPGSTLCAYRLRDGRTQTLFASPGRMMAGAAWSPDDTEIAFWRMPGEGAEQTEVWVYSLVTGQARKVFASTSGTLSFEGHCNFCLDFSAAGRGLAYWSAESGAPEVYLRPYPEAGPSRQVSSGGGFDARWSADGKTIYYAASSGAILSVAVGPAPAYRLGAPQQVLDASTGSALYGVSRDGRFLRQPTPVPPPLRVITNWQARATRALSELRRR